MSNTRTKLEDDEKARRDNRENPFNTNVLIGNWFEERFGDKNDKKAITPGICGQSDCTVLPTIYQKDYMQHESAEGSTACQQFIQWKQTGFRNRLQGEMSNLKLWDSKQYEKNVTTTTDVLFNILPQERAKRGPFNILEKPVKEDLLQSYGNYTTTGLLKLQAWYRQQERRTPDDVSHYKNAFKRIPLNPNRRICKGPQKKTNIINP